jgi:hypothetical protein
MQSMTDYYDLIPFGETLSESNQLRIHEVRPIVLLPRRWDNFPNRVPLNWRIVKFDENELGNIPDDQRGVYTFVVIPGIANHISCSYLFYVGKTERTFRARYQDYLRGQRTGKIEKHKYRMLLQWRNHLWFCYAAIEDVDLIKQVEDDLIEAYIPPFNKQYPTKFLRDAMGAF